MVLTFERAVNRKRIQIVPPRGKTRKKFALELTIIAGEGGVGLRKSPSLFCGQSRIENGASHTALIQQGDPRIKSAAINT